MNLVLGPLLGLEADYKYTVCFLLPKDQQSTLSLVFTVGDQSKTIDTPDTTIELVKNTFVRFSFVVPENLSQYEVSYQIFSDDVAVQDVHSRDFWRFTVAGKSEVPNIGYASCNGNSKEHPSELDPRYFALWDRMKVVHETIKPLHLLLMGGDQLYADTLWDNVTYFNGLKKWGFITRKAIRNKRLNKLEEADLEHQLRVFYEELYIASWSHVNMSYVMSSCPTVMIWDDHDIVDGWGSYDKGLQKSQIMQLIFRVAKEYFEVFQVRSTHNSARTTKNDFSQRISYRNNEIFVLDNRSHRTAKRVMSQQQFTSLETELSKPMFASLPEALQEERQILCVVPVPIAHLDYYGLAERLLRIPGTRLFRYSIHDDALDHWDHKAHKGQLKRLLDLFFKYARNNDVNYLTFISGDVHTGGGATISSSEHKKYATQLISSGIAHEPPPWIVKAIMKCLSRNKLKHAGYLLDFKSFGNFGKPIVRKRNFGILYHDNRMNSELYTLEEGKPYYRNLKSFN